MGHQLRTCAIVLALLGAVDVAAAQDKPATPPSQSTTAGGLNLNQAQERTVMQGLRGEQTQPTPAGPQAQVGSRVPDSVTPHAMPDNVTAQVPETKNYLFVRLPDRVLIIDPASKTVAEIILATDTTGSSPSSSPDSSSTRPKQE